MLKGIIFDLDDTLLQTKQTKFQALKETGRKFYGQDITDKQLSLHWGKPFREFMGAVFGGIDDPDTLISNYKSVLPEFPNKPYPDALSVINKLTSRYKLGILSSASKYLVGNDLAVCGFDPGLFLYIQSEDDTVVHKPDPDVFIPILKIYREHNVSPDELLFTGDTIGDYQAGTGVGLHFVGIAGRTASKEDFDAVNVRSVASLSDFYNLAVTL